MTDPCKRHVKRIAVDFRVVSNDERTFYVVGEQRECLKCGDRVVRMVRGSIGKSPRDALQAYGCTEAEIARYLAQHFPAHATLERVRHANAAPPIEAPTTGWPFPCSAHRDQRKRRKPS